MRFRAFVIASILLFISAVIAVWKDFDKDWRKYQSEFNKIETVKTQDELDSLKKSIDSDPEFKKISADIKGAEDKLSTPEAQNKKVELEAKIKKLKFDTYLAERSAKFTKSSIDALEYQIIKGTNTAQNTSSIEAERDQLKQKWETQKQEAGLVKDTLEKAQQELKDQSKEYSTIKSKYDDKLEKVDVLEKKLDSIRKRPAFGEIDQIIVSELKTVDRCASCHQAINKDGFEDKKYPKVFQTHPNRNLFLVKHNVKEFGCVVCHQGQGLATTKPNVAHGWVPFWDKPMFQGKQVEASCIKCHKTTDNIQADFFNKGKELVTGSNCFACHKLEGTPAGLKNGPPLLQAASKLNPSWMVNWVENPRHYLPKSKMPTFNVTNDDAKAITAYVLGNSDPNYGERKNVIPNPALSTKGEGVFKAKGCNSCHAVKGAGGTVGPDLGKIASKNNPTWLFNWIKNPRSYHPTTIMPNLGLSDDEALAVVSWLQQYKWDDMPKAEVNLNDKKLAEHGKELVKSLGCASCHNVPGIEGAQNCPELTNEAEKDIHKFDFGYSHLDPKRGIYHLRESYIYNKIRNPWVFNDFIKARMPRFWFTDDQANAVYTYIMGVTAKHEDMPYKYIYKDKTAEK